MELYCQISLSQPLRLYQYELVEAGTNQKNVPGNTQKETLFQFIRRLLKSSREPEGSLGEMELCLC